MAAVNWIIRLFDLSGNPIEIDYQAINPEYSGTGTNEVLHATDRRMNFALNGIDSASFTVYLDDPMATELKKFRTIKIWRTVADFENDKHLSYDYSRPAFSGTISSVTKSGAENTQRIQVQSPLWKLQSRFHVENHYLVNDVDVLNNGLKWRQGPLLYRLIELVDDAFGAASDTGIVQGGFPYTGPIVAPFFIAKGSNTWVNFDRLLSKPGSVDLNPEYYHADGSTRQLDFYTVQKRGNDISVTGTPWKYHTDTGWNLEDLTEEGSIIPGEFGNFLWVVGQGGPNSFVVAEESDTTTQYGMDEVGIYMKYIAENEVKQLGKSGMPEKGGAIPIAETEILRARVPKERYTASFPPGSFTYYEVDWTLGDVVRLDADKGSLQVVNKKQRVYEVGLSMSDNNLETATATIADDFTGKVVAA
jgi:hypothetical protein